MSSVTLKYGGCNFKIEVKVVQKKNVKRIIQKFITVQNFRGKKGSPIIPIVFQNYHYCIWQLKRPCPEDKKNPLDITIMLTIFTLDGAFVRAVMEQV